MTGFLKMGYYRGVPQRPKREEMDKIAAEMRAHYLNHGKGCKTRAKVIARRLDAIDRRLAEKGELTNVSVADQVAG